MPTEPGAASSASITSGVKGAKTTVSPSNSMLMVSRAAGLDLLPEALCACDGVDRQGGDARRVHSLAGHAADDQALVRHQEGRLDTRDGEIPSQCLLERIRPRLPVVPSHSAHLFDTRSEKLQPYELRGALGFRRLTITYLESLREPCELGYEHPGPGEGSLLALAGSSGPGKLRRPSDPRSHATLRPAN